MYVHNITKEIYEKISKNFYFNIVLYQKRKVE